MKKLISSMLMLLCAITTFAATNDAVTLTDGWYTFKANNSSRYAQFNGERIIKATVNYLADGVTYYVTKGDGNKYTIQTPNGKYLTYKGTSNGDQIAVVDATGANDNNKWWTIREGNSENLRTIVPSTNVGNDVPGWNFSVNYNGANGALGFWGCNDGGSQWIISKTPVLLEEGKAKIKCANIVMSYDGTNIVKSDDENSIFTITMNEAGNRFSIQTKDGKFFVNNNNSLEVVDANVATDENKWWSFFANIGNGTEGAIDIVPSADNIANNTNAFNWAKTIEGKGANSGLAYWSANDNNSYCTIEWETVECIYNLNYENEKTITETANVVIGVFFPNIKTVMPWGAEMDLSTVPSGIITNADVNDEGKIVKDIPIASTLPFIAANSYDKIEKWYYINFDSDNRHYLYHNPEADHIALNKKSLDLNNEDAYFWAFVGNPFDGFQIVNKLAGEGWILSSSTTIEGNGASTYPIMTELANIPSDNNELWTLTGSSHATGGFFVAQKDHATHIMNSRDSKLAYWTGGTGAGSTFILMECTPNKLTEFNQNKCYTATVKERGGWAVDTEGNFVSYNQAGEVEDKYKQFAILSIDNENYYLFNVGANAFVTKDGKTAQDATDPIALIDASVEFGSRVLVYFKDYTDGYINIDPNKNIEISNWGNVDHGNAISFIESADFDPTEALAMLSAEITYDFIYNSTLKYTETHTVTKGREYPDIETTFPFGVSATKPSGNVTENQHITIQLANTLPFEPAKDVNSITDWYYLNVREEAPTYAYYDSTVSYIKASESSVHADNKDAYSWAFVGNPWDGFSIVNKAAGTTMVLSSPNAPTTEKNAEQLPRMVEPNNEYTGNTIWVIAKPTHDNVKAENGFYIQHPTATSYAINRQSYNSTNSLCYWTGRDTGSTFQVVLRDDTEELLEAIADANTLCASITGKGVGYATSESLTAIVAAIAAAEEAIDNKTDFVTALTGIQNAIANIKTIQPASDKYYTIKNANTGNYMNVSDGAGATVYNGAAALNEMFAFKPVKDNDDVFYLYNVKRGQYLSTTPTHGSGQASFGASDSKDAATVTIKNLGKANQVSIVPQKGTTTGATLHNDTNYSTVVGWNGGADSKSAWLIEEITDPEEFVHTLTVGEVGYATLYLACDVTIPDGIEAFVAPEFDEDGNLELEPITTGILPAYNAIVVKADAGSYRFNFKYPTEEGDDITNLLKGTTVKTSIEEEAYVLSNIRGIGMYKAEKKINTDTTNDDPEVTYEAWLNNAFKAYLPASSVTPTMQQSTGFSFRFNTGATTAVEKVEMRNEKEEIYDLTGRKLQGISGAGIYIIDGKKVLVK